MGSRTTPRDRQAALQALADRGATQGERQAAAAALRRHRARHGDLLADPEPTAEPWRWIGVGSLAWYAQAVSPQLARTIAPCGRRCFLSPVRLRRRALAPDPRQCVGCLGELHPGDTAWRPIAYNGNHRMDRICLACLPPMRDPGPDGPQEPAKLRG